MEKIVTGSRAFFSGFADFRPHDTDVVLIEEPGTTPYLFKGYTRDKSTKTCCFHIVRNDKDKMIRWMVKHALPMSICMFLVPDFVREFNIIIEDLANLEPMRYRLDERHEYLGIIYDHYIANGKMEMTAEQLNEAYEVYKNARRHIYPQS